MALTPGSRLGTYEILAPLGEGGMREVYRARDPRLDREVAIEVLADALAHDPDALARFEREATSVAKLSHPNILAIHEFGRDNGRASGAATYHLEARRTTEYNADEAYAVKWLGDNRRLVYFAKAGTELVVLDTVTRKRTPIDVRLPAAAVINEMFAVSPDNRAIYYGAARSQTDIWIVER